MLSSRLMLFLETLVQFFAWEPSGQRFAFIHGEELQRASVSFYSMVDPKTKTNALTSLVTLEKRNINRLVWSPTGNFIGKCAWQQ